MSWQKIYSFRVDAEFSRGWHIRLLICSDVGREWDGEAFQASDGGPRYDSLPEVHGLGREIRKGELLMWEKGKQNRKKK